jgi:glycosyltransferase involved in cell wall biosynthesis
MNINKSKLKVLFVLGSLRLGGGERQIMYFLKLLDRKYFVPILCIFSKTGPLEKELPIDVKVYDLTFKRTIMPFVIWHLFALILKEKPQIVYSNLAGTNIPLGFVRIITALFVRKTLYCISVVNNFNYYNKKTKILARFLMPRMDIVFACASGLYQQLKSKLNLSKEKLKVLYNGVDVDFIRKRSVKPVDHEWLESKWPCIVTVADFIPQKGLHDLIRAFSIVNLKMHSYLILIGDGKLRKELEALAIKLGVHDKIDFLGYKANSNKYVKKADVFVLSSHWEGLATVLLEAAIVGTPIAATNTPFGVTDVIKDGVTGLIAPVGNINVLSEKIITLLNDKKLKEKCTKNAYEHVLRKYSIQEIVRKFERYSKDRYYHQ